MKETAISVLERELSLSLPAAYKSALMKYPFTAGSVSEEMLVADAKWLLEHNRPNDDAVPKSGLRHRQPPSLSEGLFQIGVDGGELQYYLNVKSSSGEVLEYDLETHRLSQFAQSVEQYLEKIRRIDAEIDAEEAAGEARANAIPEWRHTLRFTAPAVIGLLLYFVVLPLIVFGVVSLYRRLVE